MQTGLLVDLAREIVWMGYAQSLFLKAEAALRWPSLVDETADPLFERYQGIYGLFMKLMRIEPIEYINESSGWRRKRLPVVARRNSWSGPSRSGCRFPRWK